LARLRFQRSRVIAILTLVGATACLTNLAPGSAVACGSVRVIQHNVSHENVAHGRSVTAPIFMWPAKGNLLVSICSDRGGVDQIDIAAPEGTVVRAAADGLVTYAGNELKGYGNLLLIWHGDGWVTVYALNSELLRKRGDRVRRGQAVARMGPRLHFEMRKGSRPVNPLDYLPARL
jgi:murein DD-endopeptidase MepM/ murein hydrolase activator NlpD